MARHRLAVTALSCALAACGGSAAPVVPDPPGSTTPTVTVTTTTMAPSTTTTTTTTSTTTIPPTTSTTHAPVPIVGWDGEGISGVDLAFSSDYAEAELRGILAQGLDAMGLSIGPEGTPMTVTVAATPLSADYGSAGTCFTGARIALTITLDTQAIGVSVERERPTEFLVLRCDSEPSAAPFRYPYEAAVVASAVDLFAEAAVPLLTTLLAADHFAFDARIDAVQAVRLMAWDAIPPDAQFAFLDGTLEFAGRTTHITDDSDDARRYRQAVRHLFDEALAWEIDIPVTGNASADAAVIAIERSLLAARYAG